MKLYLGHEFFTDPDTGERHFDWYAPIIRWLMAGVAIIIVALSTLPFYGLWTIAPAGLSRLIIPFQLPIAILTGWHLSILALYDDKYSFQTMIGFLRRALAKDGTR